MTDSLLTADQKHARRKVRTTIELTAEQFAALRSLSEQTRVPVAAYVREAIDAWLRRNGARWRAK